VAIAGAAALGAWGWHRAPGIAFERALDQALVDAGARIEVTQVNGARVEYAVAGEGTPILLVHGFAGDKRVFSPYVARLRGARRVLAPDLPGHGASSRAAEQGWSVDAQGEFLGAFVDAVGLERVHVLGISMGGGAALAFALDRPDRVESLTLINPWGVPPPTPSDHDRQLARGVNVFFPRDRAELDRLSEYVTGVPLALPDRLAEHVLEQAHDREEFHREVFEQLYAGPRLDDRLGRLRVPTLVVVGEADRIVHPSVLEAIRARAPAVVGERLPGCAHIFLGPCFERAFRRVEAFLAEPAQTPSAAASAP
jgi:pimeloyl-ACP methyl ester carboxylesterase